MKLILCGCVIIYGIISCISVAAAPISEEDDGGISGRGIRIDMHECTGQYLKKKGKLSQNEPTGDNWSMCRALIDTGVRSSREDFQNKAKEDLPNELTCLMREYDENEVTDFIMKNIFYTTYASIPKNHITQVAAIANEGEMLRTKIATACGIEQNKFGYFMRSVYMPPSQRVT